MSYTDDNGRLHYRGITKGMAAALYTAHKDDSQLSKHRTPTVLCVTNDRKIAAMVEKAVQIHIRNKITRDGLTASDRMLWSVDGAGGTGHRFSRAPFIVCSSFVIHNDSEDNVSRYPKASKWSLTLPVDNVIFKGDLHPLAKYILDVPDGEISDDTFTLPHDNKRLLYIRSKSDHWMDFWTKDGKFHTQFPNKAWAERLHRRAINPEWRRIGGTANRRSFYEKKELKDGVVLCEIVKYKYNRQTNHPSPR